MKKEDVKISSMDSVPNRPYKDWKAGNIQAAIWKNKKNMEDGSEIEFKTVSLTRSYKKPGEDLWRHDVLNLRRNDIQKVMVVLQKAQEEVLLSEKKDEGD
ncbi:MAG: hypothetical protein Q8Q42_04650 [Nanoarchaeota archaeon]|nr:hypothetical protein [Nanoarchaeota archaeon]